MTSMGQTGKKRGGLGVSDEIDTNLRRVYEQVLNEELPDRFANLLDRLKKGEHPEASGNAEREEDGK